MLSIAIFLITAWLAFACLYYSLYTLSLCEPQNAFRGVLPKSWVFLQFLYFGLVTLATVGFGDIVPNSLIAQICVALEIFLGFATIVFLFFAISTTFTFDEKLDHPERP